MYFLRVFFEVGLVRQEQIGKDVRLVQYPSWKLLATIASIRVVATARIDNKILVTERSAV
jgi:hypothetical protein